MQTKTIKIFGEPSGEKINVLSHNICRILLFLFVSIFLLPKDSSAQEDLNVLGRWLKYSDASNALYHHLSDEAFTFLDLREESVSRLNTTGEWQIMQNNIKATIWDITGPFNEKTPLNPKITGKIKKDGYRIENVIYESLPGFYVTASLFIPDNIKKPVPGILFCSGHSDIAYRRPLYQQPLLNLVKKGFVVLAFDPLGQGERLQYYDPETGKSAIGSSTKEHSYPSVQTALIGQSVGRYFIWDGIRGIDYLVSRKEVDPERIGVHGLSGGGTQTAYISAMDERVNASAPAGYITTFSRLIESIGVQDGEQNFYHGIIRGIDHAGFIEARIPKPTLIMATTRDFFNIEGSRESYKEVKRVYDIFGKPGNIELTEDDEGHGYTQINREAMYAFFRKHLQLDGPSEEVEVDYLTEKELQKTPTGQLASSLGGETVFTLNLKEANKYFYNLQNSRKDIKSHTENVKLSARQLSGYRDPSLSDKPVFTGRYQREGYNIEKYFIKGEGEYVLPFLLFRPEVPNDKGIIYLHSEGKASEAAEGGEIEWLTKQGYTVMAPDLTGTGELGKGSLKGDAFIQNISYNMWFTAMLIGRSITGIQAGDIVKLSHLLDEFFETEQVYGVAHNELSPALLHAAAMDQVISRVMLVKPYSSYSSIVKNRFYNPLFVHSLVPGALTKYDLPDLAVTLAPRKLSLAGVTDCNGKYEDSETIKEDIAVIKNGFRNLDAAGQLQIISREIVGNPAELYNEWVK
jgi:dienelactone hydrolase